mmetsp:Transcript_21707/g.38532  ORF Transcript_21707/g.38532 Transcript_21707/m.38532 type:complete len:209 (+) Transcript_21707:719-1345(+)
MDRLAPLHVQGPLRVRISHCQIGQGLLLRERQRLSSPHSDEIFAWGTTRTNSAAEAKVVLRQQQRQETRKKAAETRRHGPVEERVFVQSRLSARSGGLQQESALRPRPVAVRPRGCVQLRVQRCSLLVSFAGGRRRRRTRSRIRLRHFGSHVRESHKLPAGLQHAAVASGQAQASRALGLQPSVEHRSRQLLLLRDHEGRQVLRLGHG